MTAIPPNRKNSRLDEHDEVYKNEAAKFRAVVREIEEKYKQKRPVLVGTISIEKSEMLSNMLREKKIVHNVLNAKQHEQEAYIVAQAGRLGAVTIATNMAGRGTDILLGGNPEFLARDFLIDRGVHPNEVTQEYINDLIETKRKETEIEKEKVVALGGLCILGTERHESRRIDNQLRGRAGRQGDPGTSKFYLALDDSLMRLFGGDKVAGWMEALNVDEDTPLNAPMIAGAIERAQKRVEQYHFDIRKSVIKFDDVLTEQRGLIYSQRRRVLEGKGLRESMMHMLQLELARLMDTHLLAGVDPKDWPAEAIPEFLAELHMRMPQLAQEITADVLAGQTFIEITLIVQHAGQNTYLALENSLTEAAIQLEKEHGLILEGIEDPQTEEDNHPLRRIERDILLQVVDARWIDHLHSLDTLREGIGLRAYGQKDPLIEYKREAYDMFQQLTYDIQRETITLLVRARIEIQLEKQLDMEASLHGIEQEFDTELTEAVEATLE